MILYFEKNLFQLFRREKPGNIGKIDGDDRFKEHEDADAGKIIMLIT